MEIDIRKSEELYQFLLDKTWELTDHWYESLDKDDTSGLYSSNDPEVIEKLKRQNHEFHERFCKAFIEDESDFLRDFESWVMEIARDEEHLSTPISYILREFFRTQGQYLDLIEEFNCLHKDKYTKEDIIYWNRVITDTSNKVVTWFTQEHNKYAEDRLKAQQEVINELSTPVIPLGKEIALLPLVGDIDTQRAKFIYDNELEQCSAKEINYLLIDLSGVFMVDTMVAHQLFQLMDTLALIGVKSVLSGIRPEIAQTAVQLGICFENVSTISSIEQAMTVINNMES